MEGYLDAYNPIASGTPAGIFVNRVEVKDTYFNLKFYSLINLIHSDIYNFEKNIGL